MVLCILIFMFTHSKRKGKRFWTKWWQKLPNLTYSWVSLVMGRKIMVLSSVPCRFISEYYQFRGTGCLHLLGCEQGVNVVSYTDNLQERPTKGHRKHK